MKPKIVFIVFLLFTFSLAGCWDQKIINQQMFIAELGLEAAPDSKLLLTMVASRFNPQGLPRDALFTVPARLIREGMLRSDLFATGEIEFKKIKHVYCSAELAARGIHPLLEVFDRSPFLPLQSYLIVVEGSPHQLLQKLSKINNQPSATIYVDNLLKRNINLSYLPATSLGAFEIAYFAPGIDPVLPILRQTEEGATISGTALFANDRMVGRINPWQTALLLAMMNRFKPTELFFDTANDSKTATKLKSGIAVAITQARRQLQLRIRDNQPPEFKIILHIQGNLLEYHWDQFDDRKQQTKLEQRLATGIKTNCLQILHIAQRSGSDPMGLGNLIRAKYNSYWKKSQWAQTYRNAKIGVEVHFKLLHYGLIN